MLIQHIAQNDKILIQVDSDCDGYTSAALLINYLNCLFPNFVKNNISYRMHTDKQHGIIPNSIPEDVKLVIAPDSSSNNFYEHEFLKTVKGIDTLVIDHHEADKISKYGCIINNQLCDYPTKSLSGVGMVYKFCSYIDQLLNVKYAENFLDLVALGMIADMMDLRDFETKHLITQGLKKICNPYFYNMCKKNAHSLGEEITPIGVAFYIAPYVNATIRIGTQEEKLLLFESMLDYKGYELIPSTKRGCKGQIETRAEQACRNCINIKNRQTKIRDTNLNIIEQLIQEQNLLENKILIIKLEPELNINKNLTGLIANQLMSKYQRPVLLLHKTTHYNTIKNNEWENWLVKKGYIIQQIDDSEIIWEGSGRGYDKSKFNDFKAFLNNSNMFLYAEGHPNAFGAGILDKNISKFIEYSNKTLKNFNFTPCYPIDFIYLNNNVKTQDILDIANLKSIWGQGINESLIMIKNISISINNIQLMAADKNPTIKITLPNGIELLKFKSSKEEYEILCPKSGCIKINIIGKCDKNTWNGLTKPQIIIEDYEITDKLKYYF